MNTNTNEKKLRQLETFKRLINIMLTFVCLGLEIGLFAYHWLFHFQYSVVEALRDFWFKGHLLEIAIYAVVLFMFSTMYGGMRLGYLKNVEIIFSQVFATLMANLLIYAELSVMAFQLFEPYYFFVMMLEQTLVVIVYINIANYIYRRIFPPESFCLFMATDPLRDYVASLKAERTSMWLLRPFMQRPAMRLSARGFWSLMKAVSVMQWCWGISLWRREVRLLSFVTDIPSGYIWCRKLPMSY